MAGFGCMFMARSTSAVVAWVLLFVGIGLILEAVTALFARSGDATEHRQ